MSLIEHNLPFFVVALVVGIIPHKVLVGKNPSKRKGYHIELEAHLWQFTCREQEWCLRITGISLLSRRIRDDLDK